ncbi:lytic transglycosylase domain-containing protein [Oleidesulfovibrio alaskensis]
METIRKLISLVTIVLMSFSSVAHASTTLNQERYPLIWQDVYLACERYKVPFWAMMLILQQENGYVGHSRRNTNGSHDYGPFQVNSYHLRHNGQIKALGITANQLQYDGPVNAVAAAIVFRQAVDSSRSIWEAIVKYHSCTPRHQKRYLARFIQRLQRHGTVEQIIKQANRIEQSGGGCSEIGTPSPIWSCRFGGGLLSGQGVYYHAQVISRSSVHGTGRNPTLRNFSLGSPQKTENKAR